MKFLKAYIAGMFFPAIIVPFIYLTPLFLAYLPFREYPIQLLALSIIGIWGAWNGLTVIGGGKLPKISWKIKCLISGFILGVLKGWFFHEVFPVFKYVLNYEGNLYIIVLPIVYAIIWGFVVNKLNRMCDIY
jgi:hypothetical protein